MKIILISGCVLTVSACASFSATAPSLSTEEGPSGSVVQCVGDTTLPPAVAAEFAEVSNSMLLQASLGQAGEGMLCQGQVYKATGDTGVTVYRAWNSTNPTSQLGNWWVFEMPEGEVSQYRHDYEICYQWSPLDRLTQCTLATGVEIVLGTGQSATCSDFLIYPVSSKQQVYIDDAFTSVTGCTDYDGEFSWMPSTQ